MVCIMTKENSLRISMQVNCISIALSTTIGICYIIDVDLKNLEIIVFQGFFVE